MATLIGKLTESDSIAEKINAELFIQDTTHRHSPKQMIRVDERNHIILLSIYIKHNLVSWIKSSYQRKEGHNGRNAVHSK